MKTKNCFYFILKRKISNFLFDVFTTYLFFKINSEEKSWKKWTFNSFWTVSLPTSTHIHLLEFRGICWIHECRIPCNQIQWQINIITSRSISATSPIMFPICVVHLLESHFWKPLETIYHIVEKKLYVIPSSSICWDKMCRKFNHSCERKICNVTVKQWLSWELIYWRASIRIGMYWLMVIYIFRACLTLLPDI